MRAGEKLWAVGDITGKGAFTHVSMYQAAVVVRDILGEDGPWADYRAVARVTFTEPEVASVGLTEQQARDAGLAVATASGDLGARGWLAKADGVVKLVADRDRGVLVGATVVGPAGGEILSMLVTARARGGADRARCVRCTSRTRPSTARSKPFSTNWFSSGAWWSWCEWCAAHRSLRARVECG